MKLLLSYPRSGNHLVRFFIELLSEQPTLGVIGSQLDVPLYKNQYKSAIPFNIEQDAEFVNTDTYYRKSHLEITDYTNIDEMIFILRSPRECLLRHNGFTVWNQNSNWHSYEAYFKLVDSYLNYPGKKCLFFYEDITKHRTQFVQQLYDFLDINNPSKLDYIMENIDKLYELCVTGTGRYWEPNRSNGNAIFYYPKISISIKDRFDAFLSSQLCKDKFRFIQEKYSIPILPIHQTEHTESESKNS